MIKKISAKLYGSKDNNKTMMQNMMVLLTGTGIGKIIGLISIPIITRIYSPSEMGVLSIFIALAGILISLGTLRYSVALPLPKNKHIAMNLAVLCFLILTLISFLITIIFIFYRNIILELLSSEILLDYWYLLPISIFFLGTYEILNQWAIREKNFNDIAKTKVTQSIIGESTKILFGILSIKPLGLIIGYIISQAGGLILLSKDFISYLKKNTHKISKSKILFLSRYYKDLPKYRLPSQFLLIVSMQSPLLFSAWLYGTDTTGQLGLALMALGIPIQLIGKSIGQAYYAEIATIGKNNRVQIKKVANNVTKKLFFIAIIPSILIYIFAEELFILIFGEQWVEAGTFSSILVIYLLFQLVSAPLINTLSVLRKEKVFLIFNLRRIIFITGIFLFSYYINLNAIDLLILYSFFMAIHYGLISYQIHRMIDEK